MPKNPALEYAAAEPAFLRRLKAGNAALDGRHNVQIPRARGNPGRGGRLDMDGEDGEDDPVMLDEFGKVVTKEEMEEREKETDEKANGSAQEGGEANEEVQEAAEERRVKDGAGVSSGFGRKRKAVKVVGDDDPAPTRNDDGDEEAGSAKSLKESTKDLKDAVAQQKADAKKEAAAAVPATKKGKRKKLKLSFEEPE